MTTCTLSVRGFGVLLLSGAMSLSLVRDNSAAQSGGDVQAKFVLPIEYIYHGKSRDGGQIRSAVLSADFVCALEDSERGKFGPDVVEGVARLLEDRRYALGAANILACIGPSALAAVPALEKALMKAKPGRPPPFVIQPDFKLDYALRAALRRIRGADAP